MLAAIKAQVGRSAQCAAATRLIRAMLVLAIQQPEPLLREDAATAISAVRDFAARLAFYREMFQRQWAPPITGTQISNVWDELGRGYYTFYIHGRGTSVNSKRRLPPSSRAPG